MTQYTTPAMTPRQADDFIAAFDAAMGTETETDDHDAGLQTVTCFELEAGEVAKARRLAKKSMEAHPAALLPKPYDTVGVIIRYEQGDLGTDETVELMQHLIDTGMAWTLQGHYGRIAHYLIETGQCTVKGGN